MSATSGSELGVAELEERFREFTLLMYTTSVPLDELSVRVVPYLAPNIEFIDPVIRARGAEKFRIGLLGFHCAFRFDFDIFQLNVSMSERGDRGRALVDGVMNLRQLRVYTYPLRTILAFDFVMTGRGEGFEITRLEEIWSFGDLIQNAPLLGTLYAGFRFLSGYFFTGFFWLSCAAATRLPWSKQFQRS